MKRVSTPYVGVFILSNGIVLNTEFASVEEFESSAAACEYAQAFLLPMDPENPSVSRLRKVNGAVIRSEEEISISTVAAEEWSAGLGHAAAPVDMDEVVTAQEPADGNAPISWNPAVNLPYAALCMDVAGNIRGFQSTVDGTLPVDATGNCYLPGVDFSSRYGTVLDVNVMNQINTSLRLTAGTGVYASPRYSVVLTSNPGVPVTGVVTGPRVLSPEPSPATGTIRGTATGTIRGTAGGPLSASS